MLTRGLFAVANLLVCPSSYNRILFDMARYGHGLFALKVPLSPTNRIPFDV